jgi:hypothetical protein
MTIFTTLIYVTIKTNWSSFDNKKGFEFVTQQILSTQNSRVTAVLHTSYCQRFPLSLCLYSKRPPQPGRKKIIDNGPKLEALNYTSKWKNAPQRANLLSLHAIKWSEHQTSTTGRLWKREVTLAVIRHTPRSAYMLWKGRERQRIWGERSASPIFLRRKWQENLFVQFLLRCQPIAMSAICKLFIKLIKGQRPHTMQK